MIERLKFLLRTRHLASTLAPYTVVAWTLTVTVCWCVWLVASQPPAPGEPERRQPPQKQATAAEGDVGPLLGTRTNPAVVSIAKSEQATKDEKAAHDQQATANWWSAFFTGIIAFLTFGLIAVGVIQWNTYRSQLTTTKATERAYVVLSHQTRLWSGQVTPILARALDIRGPNALYTERRDVWSTVEMQNHGRTPASILGGGLWIRTMQESNPQQAPTIEPPSYLPVRIPPSFVVPNDKPEITSMILWPSDSILRVEQASECLWLMGYIDYRDQFDGFHRAGYGRWYDPVSHLLLFHPTTGPMNYDRPMTPEERQEHGC